MIPRSILFGVLLLLLGVASSMNAVHAAGLTASKPNIILVMTDDQGYGPIASHGHPWLKTPNLDALYKTSTRFNRFLVSPTCAPTRSAMMTGRHPMKNGVTHTILERERMTLDATILPQVLKTAGYTSGIFGKWHLGDEEEYQPHQRGFDETFIHGAGGIGQAYECSCADVPDNKYFNPVIRHNGSFVKTEGYCTDIFFSAAMGWVKQQAEEEKPFFAYITTNAPHFPFVAPPKNRKRFAELGFSKKTTGFYGMVENIDENMGRLMGNLEKWGLMENTVVIFMSDNGMTGPGSAHSQNPQAKKPLGKTETGSDLYSFNAGMKGLKGSPHEGGVRVPFFIRWDGHIKPAQEVNQLAAHIDLLPTLAALVGAELPADQVEGRNLLPLIEEPKSAWADRYLYTHVARWKTGENPDDYQWNNFAIRNTQYRFVNNTELYDIQADPGQQHNVINQHPEVISKMKTAYNIFWEETRPLMINESAPMSKTRPFHELYEKQLKTTGIPKWKAPAL